MVSHFYRDSIVDDLTELYCVGQFNYFFRSAISRSVCIEPAMIACSSNWQMGLSQRLTLPEFLLMHSGAESGGSYCIA